MATERLSLRKTKEILRQKWALQRSHREVALSVGVSTGAVSGAVQRATAAGLDWAAAEGLSEDELERRLYGQRVESGMARPLPDPVWIHEERKRPGVTLELLHMEYREREPNGYGYTQFCEHYRRWLVKRRLSMRQVHRGGEKLFIDYSGKKPCIVDPKTGEIQEVELFVTVLGASSWRLRPAVEPEGGGGAVVLAALAVLGPVLKDVQEGRAGLSRRSQLVRVIAVGEDPPAVPEGPVGCQGHANRQSLHAAGQGSLIVGL